VGFGSDPGPIDGTAVRFGSADVQVTRSRAQIVAESLYVAPEQLIGPNQTRGSRDIFGKLRESMRGKGRPTLVVIHGFSNSFSDAIERAGTILDFYGVDMNVFSFTWPSRGSKLPVPLPYADYVHDRETARASGLAMARTMRILFDYIDSLGPAEQCRQPMHLICHSMGNYAFRHAVQALMQLPLQPVSASPIAVAQPDPAPMLVALPTEAPDPIRLRRTFEQVILVAADEDEDAFDDPREMRYLPRLAGSVSVYHTREDWILSTLSRVTKFNGPRLGTDGPDNMGSISDKVSAIDVSDVIDVSQDFQSHQYYRIAPAVRDDIVAMLSGARPTQVANREALGSQRYRIVPARRRRR